MLTRPTDWDKIEGIEYGEYENLELGGHEVIIKNAYVYKSKTSGNESLKIEIDIAGNDKQKGYFQRQFDSNPNADKTWPNGACRYISLREEENCLRMFKGFTTCVEKSNPGYVWNFDETTLVGKKLCGVFGLEQYEKQDGSTGFATRLMQFRSLDKLSEVKIPKVRFLDGSQLDYEEYKEVQKMQKSHSKNEKSNEKVKENHQVIEDNMLD